ncbi:MAG: SRPBCC domain-containing protein [Bryobacteraceae bacterium]
MTKDLVVTRTYNAPLEAVWAAWTNPAAVMQWWGPNCFTCPSAAMDVRVGGLSIVCMRSPQSMGGQDMYNSWAYTRIVPHESIEFIQNLSTKDGISLDPLAVGLPPDFPRDQRCVVTFKALSPTQTELTVTQFDWIVGQMFPLAELGLTQCLDKMAALWPVTVP